MFDPVTADLLRSAPALPGLEPEELPQTLTRHYAELVARRLRGGAGEEISEGEEKDTWPLTRIADTYELVTSIHEDRGIRRAAAFVAATAQQILSQEAARTEQGEAVPVLDRDRVDAALAASILFLAAEQYADSSDAAQRIHAERQGQAYVATLLAETIRDLASGKLVGILERAGRRPQRFASPGGLEARGTVALLESLLVGIEIFAADALGERTPANAAGRFDTARSAFLRVLRLSSDEYASGDADAPSLLTTYPGPRHLASLLLAAHDATARAAVTKIDPPPGADEEFWRRWLRHRAATAPFVWPNHREAIGKEFHFTGKSAVMVLPTGAGKTTVSCLKIASVLASGKKTVFIAPTHALVDQLTTDLQEIFPEDLLHSVVSSDFDRLFATGTALRRIEVMTPERCLALLSYAPEAFDDVGLLVFDECHLLSPLSGLRRALDGMFCVLAFNSIAPEADFLFLSAMIRNGAQFADWIGVLTGRECLFVDPLWKPSRQARGVVFYEEKSIRRILDEAIKVQRREDATSGRRAKHLRTAAKAELTAEPFALFGLRHNWLDERQHTADCALTKISGDAARLNGELQRNRLTLKPNVNKVAAHIAVAAARNRLKAIVFVNVKSHAISTAREIATTLGEPPKATAEEMARWDALDAELGGRKHSLLSGPAAAVPHNSQMLRLERELAERMFRRQDGALVIVATPTLAQGLNLPAHLAILASDMRADLDDGGREPLAGHEILNAAARAGRAGHLANGVVLLIPEAILTFAEGRPFDEEVMDKLRSILPEDDRCLDMNDPLEIVLDRISHAALDDPEVEYALNRLSTAVAPGGAESEVATRFAMNKSFAAFMAAQRKATQTFAVQIARLNRLLSSRNAGTQDRTLLELAARSGAPASALIALRERLAASVGATPATIPEWVAWIFSWLAEDANSRSSLLGRDRRAILGAVGRKMDSALTKQAIRELLPGVLAWLAGEPLREIERALGGDPQDRSECPRARYLVTGVVPMGLTFVVGLVVETAREVSEIAGGSTTPRSIMDCLPTAVRRGFDTPSKLAFADLRKGLLSRVQYHRAFVEEIGESLDAERTDDYASLVGRMGRLLGQST